MNITKTTKNFLIISTLLMALAIMIGAFGAHGLKPYLDEYGTEIFQKGSNYQFYSTLGLLFISILSVFLPTSKKLKVSFFLVLGGMVVFSFSLYILALTKILWLGAITPIGGSLMIAGWFTLAYTLYNEL